MNLGENIKKLRKRTKLSQVELAKLMNVNQYNISYWEINRSEPSTTQLIKLSIIFNVSVDYLLGNDTIFTSDETEFKSTIRNLELDDEELMKELLIIYNKLNSKNKKEFLQ